ncbi:MAG TPA: GntR family transcriptional regulator [Acidimicrobiales bacterium]|nr:GntR family transcriptional regulator [Acidimicrobiales bacterium]
MASPSGNSRRTTSQRSTANRGNRIVRTSSAEHIALHIRTLIFDGVLLPGMRVPQDAIAQDLGVSRIPVREALIVLEREGWVTIEMHRGAFINALDKRAVHDHYELFGLIYGFAAKRALARGSKDLPDALAEIQADFAAATDPEDQRELSIAFHGAILRAAESPRIIVVLRAMSALVPGNFFELVPGAVDVEKRGLAAIVRAMRANDGDRASAEYGKMMRQIGNRVTLLFDERGLFDPEMISA